eukprot:GHVS01010899.1.p1 GENE.GHVS01010899.1~~GHVS01010899.1.p1  ORF type:complete len:1040 (+),score=176.93 GHVS01010899.1:587-3706(+)
MPCRHSRQNQVRLTRGGCHLVMSSVSKVRPLETSPAKSISGSKRLRLFLGLSEATTCGSCSKRNRCKRAMKQATGTPDVSDLVRVLIGVYTLCTGMSRHPHGFTSALRSEDLTAAIDVVDKLYEYLLPHKDSVTLAQVPLANEREARTTLRDIHRAKLLRKQKEREAKILNLPAWMRATMEPDQRAPMTSKQRHLLERMKQAQDTPNDEAPPEERFHWAFEQDPEHNEFGGETSLDGSSNKEQLARAAAVGLRCMERPKAPTDINALKPSEITELEMSDGTALKLDPLDDLPVKYRFKYKTNPSQLKQLVQFNQLYNTYLRGVSQSADKSLWIDVDAFSDSIKPAAKSDSSLDETELNLDEPPPEGQSLVDFLHSASFKRLPASVAQFIALPPGGLEGVGEYKSTSGDAPTSISLWEHADRSQSLSFLHRIPFDSAHQKSGGSSRPFRLPNLAEDHRRCGLEVEAPDRRVTAWSGGEDGQAADRATDKLMQADATGAGQTGAQTDIVGKKQDASFVDGNWMKDVFKNVKDRSLTVLEDRTRDVELQEREEGERKRMANEATAAALAKFERALLDREVEAETRRTLAGGGQPQHKLCEDSNEDLLGLALEEEDAKERLRPSVDRKTSRTRRECDTPVDEGGLRRKLADATNRTSSSARRKPKTLADMKEDSADEDERFSQWKNVLVMDPPDVSPDTPDPPCEDTSFIPASAQPPPPRRPLKILRGAKWRTKEKVTELGGEKPHSEKGVSARSAGTGDGSPDALGTKRKHSPDADPLETDAQEDYRGPQFELAMNDRGGRLRGGPFDGRRLRLVDRVDEQLDDTPNTEEVAEGVEVEARGKREREDDEFKRAFRVRLEDSGGKPAWSLKDMLGKGSGATEQHDGAGTSLRSYHFEKKESQSCKESRLHTPYSGQLPTPRVRSPPTTKSMARSGFEQPLLPDLQKYIKPQEERKHREKGQIEYSGRHKHQDEWQEKYGVVTSFDRVYKDDEVMKTGEVPVRPDATQISRSAQALQVLLNRKRKQDIKNSAATPRVDTAPADK